MATRRTTRSVMREVLAKYPDGIGARMLNILVREIYATCSESVPQMLIAMQKGGHVLKLHKKECRECGRKVVRYKLNKKYDI